MSDREKTLTINEIYFSVQGESTWAGLPCVFVRLTFCDLRCTYCDTEYAFYEGKKQTLAEIVNAVRHYDCHLVEVTGGEPLLQKNVLPLMTLLADAGCTILLETSGAHDISKVDPRVHRIMDLKTPGSGEVERNLLTNIEHLTQLDEVKFVNVAADVGAGRHHIELAFEKTGVPGQGNIANIHMGPIFWQ